MVPLVGVLAVLWLAAGLSIGATGRVLVKSGGVSLIPSTAGGCPPASLRAVVRVSSLVGGRGVSVTATVHNVGARACPYEGRPPTAVQQLGPCGALTLKVVNGHHRDLWPGDAVYMCPLLTSELLAPGALFTATGRWNGVLARGGRAPPGRYRLVVGGHLTFGFTLL
jgi:hypothetical protein